MTGKFIYINYSTWRWLNKKVSISCMISNKNCCQNGMMAGPLTIFKIVWKAVVYCSNLKLACNALHVINSVYIPASLSLSLSLASFLSCTSYLGCIVCRWFHRRNGCQCRDIWSCKLLFHFWAKLLRFWLLWHQNCLFDRHVYGYDVQTISTIFDLFLRWGFSPNKYTEFSPHLHRRTFHTHTYSTLRSNLQWHRMEWHKLKEN